MFSFRHVMRCTKRWREGVEEFVWADEEKKVMLPLPLGVGVVREIERQACCVRGEVVYAKHLCDRLVGQREKELVDADFVRELRAECKASEEPVVVNGKRCGDCVREASGVALKKLSFEERWAAAEAVAEHVAGVCQKPCCGGKGSDAARTCEVCGADFLVKPEYDSDEELEKVMVFRVEQEYSERKYDRNSFLGAVEECEFVAGELVRCLQAGMLGVELMAHVGDCLDSLTWRAQREFSHETSCKEVLEEYEVFAGMNMPFEVVDHEGGVNGAQPVIPKGDEFVIVVDNEEEGDDEWGSLVDQALFPEAGAAGRVEKASAGDVGGSAAACALVSAAASAVLCAAAKLAAPA